MRQIGAAFGSSATDQKTSLDPSRQDMARQDLQGLAW
jgi:hypothetical protein